MVPAVKWTLSGRGTFVSELIISFKKKILNKVQTGCQLGFLLGSKVFAIIQKTDRVEEMRLTEANHSIEVM